MHNVQQECGGILDKKPKVKLKKLIKENIDFKTFIVDKFQKTFIHPVACLTTVP
jgi:hypothetical protein